MKKYTVAIIGTGRISFSLGFDKKREQPASHSFALKSNPRVNIVAACDTDEERLNKWQSFFPRTVTFSSVDALLSFGETQEGGCFDIIVVAVNEDAHLECSLKAIESKPHLIILEKPVALNVDEAEKIKAASEKYSVPILVNHERRFADDYKIARCWMDKIGELQSVNARLFSSLRVYSAEDEKSGAYSLLHDGTHLVDVVMYLLDHNAGGNESFVDGAESGAESTDADDSAFSTLSNPRLISIYRDKENAVRNLAVNFTHKFCPDVNIYISGRSRFFGFEVEVIGTEGAIKIGNGFACVYRRAESKLYTGFYSLEPLKTVKFPKKTRYFSNMVQNAVDFLDGEEGICPKCPLHSTLENGIQALSVLEEMKKFCL